MPALTPRCSAAADPETLDRFADPRAACRLLWQLSTISGTELRAASATPDVSLEIHAADELLGAAQQCLVNNIGAHTGDGLATALSTPVWALLERCLLAAAPAFHEWHQSWKPWCGDSREEWQSTAEVLSRCLRGEFQTANRRVADKAAHKTLNAYLSSAAGIQQVWPAAWERQKFLIQSQLTASAAP